MTMTPATGTRPTRMPRQKGWYIPWLFVAFFAVVVAVNGVMMHFAFSTWTGLETEGHFLKGIRYNEDLAGARAQAERAWQVQAEFTSTEPRKGIASLTLRDKHGNLLKDAKVTISLIRPTSQGHDVTLELPYLGEGRYAAPVELALEGQWDMRVEIQHATGDYQSQKRVWVQ
ncbi:FixH family protein [Azospirillum doebereinerae]|uniref:FixH family protein n=1 Tax=Azospirillum doebereinerae TaxID=92933 RepID=UPI001EE570AA|nr:FixH family protein [Azospirillum doebereinerae]MCG5243862.1 FixH family protein [Azospirillum doebereinerae]